MRYNGPIRENVKSCPFCGGKPVVNQDQFGPGHLYLVTCELCKARCGTPTDQVSLAVEMWNKRPGEEAIQRKLDSLEEDVYNMAVNVEKGQGLIDGVYADLAHFKEVIK